MILRVLRARVIEGEQARLAQRIRDEAVERALATPGLLSFQPAVREIVSTWAGFEDLAAAGPQLDEPVTVPGVASMLADSHAEHYELVIGQARSMPLSRAKLRLTRIPRPAQPRLSSGACWRTRRTPAAAPRSSTAAASK